MVKCVVFGMIGLVTIVYGDGTCFENLVASSPIKMYVYPTRH